jgi:hypothetical protein
MRTLSGGSVSLAPFNGQVQHWQAFKTNSLESFLTVCFVLRMLPVRRIEDTTINFQPSNHEIVVRKKKLIFLPYPPPYVDLHNTW